MNSEFIVPSTVVKEQDYDSYTLLTVSSLSEVIGC